MGVINQLCTEPLGDGEDFPGTLMWQRITPHRWKRLLLIWGVKTSLEAIDLQTDLTIMTSVLMDKTYTAVPPHLKSAVVILTVVSFLLEIMMAYLLVSHYVKDSTRTAPENFVDIMLNFLAAPVQLMVAPLRLGPYGSTQMGRNIGYNIT